jgi:hypothetical protein
MYLVVIGWVYVALMMSVAEATHSTGSVLGAIVTFFFYGLLPGALVVYLMGAPHRKKRLRAREAAEEAPGPVPEGGMGSTDPDAGGHASGAAEVNGVAPVREKP